MKSKTGIELITDERKRQIEKEGFTSEHDDTHINGELSQAAICYAQSHRVAVPYGWPWANEWWKPSDKKVDNLVKAGALIAAEIDRLNRGTK